MHPAWNAPYKALNVVAPFLHNITGCFSSTNQHHTFAFMLRHKGLERTTVVDFTFKILKKRIFQGSIGELHVATANDKKRTCEHVAVFAFHLPQAVFLNSVLYCVIQTDMRP